MILSEDRQNHLAHIIVDGIWKDDIVDYQDDDQALRAAKVGIRKFVETCDDVDQKVRQKIDSLKKTVIEGSPEWDVMYQKYFEEEINRRG